MENRQQGTVCANTINIAKGALEEIITHTPRLSTAEIQELKEILFNECAIIESSAGDILIQECRKTGNFYICLKGLLRNYYTHANGKVFNKSFILAPNVAGSLSEYIDGSASRFSMACVEDSLLMRIPFKWLRSVEHLTCIQKFYLHIVERLALIKERREESLLLDDAKSRYLAFAQYNPEIIARLPDYHIAAFIGITPVAFSRLKKTLLT